MPGSGGFRFRRGGLLHWPGAWVEHWVRLLWGGALPRLREGQQVLQVEEAQGVHIVFTFQASIKACAVYWPAV